MQRAWSPLLSSGSDSGWFLTVWCCALLQEQDLSTTSSRKLLQTNITDADILTFALNLEYLEVRLMWR